MHIMRARFGAFPPFSEAIELELDERVNLFIGPNGVGKSNLLRQLDLSLAISRMPNLSEWDGGQTLSLSDDWMSLFQSHNASSDVDYSQSESIEMMADPMKSHPPTITIPATSVGHPGLSRHLFRPNSPADIVAPFGTFSIEGHLESIDVQYSLDSIRDDIERLARSNEGDCSDISVSNEENILMEKYPSVSRQAANLMNAVSISYSCAKDICQEILVGDSPQNYTIFGDHSASGLPPGRVELGVMIQTDDLNPSGEKIDPIHVSDLSAGTELTFWWVRLIALVLLKHNAYQFGWEKRPAILLIDEIENHLHPTWQRRVIPALLKHFPGLQIFATTHSPFVIAGLKAGQVHLLNRDANGVITATSNTEDIIGWTADEILRVFMGVDDPTDDATAAAARELRQLRDTGPHPDERQEEQRQARMRELQQQVDPNLQAGGPRAAEDERFAENLAGILERYRQSRDLDQENG